MTLTTSTTSTRLAASAVALLLGLGLAGCGSSHDSAATPGTSSAQAGTTTKAGSAPGSSAPGKAGTNGQTGQTGKAGQAGGTGNGAGTSGASGSSSGTGSSSGKGSTTNAAAPDPNSPFVVAAAAVGQRSRDTVTTLHAMGVSTTKDDGVPHNLLPEQGKQLRATLRSELREASRLTPPKGSPAARLVASLSAYSQAAGQLAAWAPSSGPLPKAWFTRLGEADKAWTAALRDLSTASGHDILKDLPTLLMPSA